MDGYLTWHGRRNSICRSPCPPQEQHVIMQKRTGGDKALLPTYIQQVGKGIKIAVDGGGGGVSTDIILGLVA